MANVSVYNMEGNLQIIVRELRKQKHVLKLAAVEENLGDRKEPVMQDRVQQELRSGQPAEWYSLRCHVITQSD